MVRKRGQNEFIQKHTSKKKRIKAGSGEKMRKPGTKGAPTKRNFARAKQTVKKKT